MDGASIGIKLADSTFFPVLQDKVPGSKVLDLTTVRDDQTSVQINLYRSENNTMHNAEYVGTLIIEDIAKKPSGDPTIELTLTLDEFNELSAEAVDLDSGSRELLKASLATLDQEDLNILPDFDLNSTMEDEDVILGEDPLHENVADDFAYENTPGELYTMNTDDEKKSGVLMPAWLCVTILIFGIAALVIALIISARTMVLNRSIQEIASNPVIIEVPVVPVVEPEPIPEAEPIPEEITPPPVETPAEEAPQVVVIEEPEEPVVPVQPEPVPDAQNVRYKIIWGDTLWDLSATYYRDPWQYMRIARFNNIKNPDLIIAGTYITIPAK
ncbi:LysM peptidoglycan-binding domain-containing protein [Brucepastera parasyntrophica]|uniref:LysM peptidoglycan-binding domain-containing protein n=1 Tax=Brucepastera parasyntrophica TaxID=2880008 RepID=UPI00210D029C|nr:LysM peptidoglycan-binding domain-containing protein [Brucepastera parasyntrophica]ULQ60942.1 LysM peptidoglycan-binding domain-containing protein [Brucepastera parasyntrophica]